MRKKRHQYFLKLQFIIPSINHFDSYFYSWICHYDRKYRNGAAAFSLEGGNVEMRIVWYDTYPLEWCEFILDKALSCGTYLQALAANDAFYNRSTSNIETGDDHEMEPAERILGSYLY